MWCSPWHAPNRNLVAGLMKSLFRLFAVSCTYCSATIGALTPVNNGFSVQAPDGPSDQRVSTASRKSNSDLIAIRPNRICLSDRTREMASLIFQRHPAKNIGTNGIAKIHTRLAAT